MKKEREGDSQQGATACRPGAVSVPGPAAAAAAAASDDESEESNDNGAISNYQSVRASQQDEGSAMNAEEGEVREEDLEDNIKDKISNYQALSENEQGEGTTTTTKVEENTEGNEARNKIASYRAFRESQQIEGTTTSYNATGAGTIGDMIRRSDPIADAAARRTANEPRPPANNGEFLVEAQVVVEDESRPNDSATTNKSNVDDSNIYHAEFMENGVLVNKRRLCRLAGGVVILLLVVVGATVGGLCAMGRCSSTGTVVPDEEEHGGPSSIELVAFSAAMIVDLINNVTYSPVPLRHPIPPESASSSAATPEEQALAWLISSDSNKPTTGVRLVQRYALATLYFGTNGDAWKDNENWLHTDECIWFAIICGEDDSSIGTVEEIELWENNLEGGLSADLGLLSELRVFQVDGNALSGSIASSLGDNWSKLEVFEVSSNDLSGTIPSSLGSGWSNIEIFDIEDNSFSSTLPESIGNWANSIQFVFFSKNDLTGSLPATIKDWVTIEEFYAYENAFVGSPFSLMMDWTRIRTIDLYFNDFNGTLPARLGNLQEMEEFFIEANDFTGFLPEEISKWRNLKDFSAANNSFTGPFHEYFGNGLTNIELFDVGLNDFTGTLPLSLRNWGNIEQFYVDGNRFNGSIPDIAEIWLESLEEGANFTDNSFTGTFGVDLCAASPDKSIPFKVDCDEVDCPCCESCVE